MYKKKRNTISLVGIYTKSRTIFDYQITVNETHIWISFRVPSDNQDGNMPSELVDRVCPSCVCTIWILSKNLEADLAICRFVFLFISSYLYVSCLDVVSLAFRCSFHTIYNFLILQNWLVSIPIFYIWVPGYTLFFHICILTKQVNWKMYY